VRIAHPGGAVAEESAPSAVAPSPPAAPAPAHARLSKDLLAGIVLVVIGGFALVASAGLPAGTLRAVGPGALPRGLALVVLAAGLAFVVAALVRGGEPVGRWPLRGAIFIVLSLVAFALTIRTLGLAVAGPAIVIVSGAASPDTRPVELVVFAAILTAACIGLFRFALQLPIPVLIIPGVVTL
jgi:putative tricarboxylic transport membrane protein